MSKFTFSLTEKEAAEILERIPSTQKEFIRLIERAAIYGVERLVMLQDPSYLTSVYKVLATKFQKPFSAWVQKYAPVQLTKDLDKEATFRFSMKTLKDMAEKEGLKLEFEESGKCKTPEALQSIMLVVKARMSLETSDWASPKSTGETKEKKAVTKDDIVEALKKVVKKAADNDIILNGIEIEGLPKVKLPDTFMEILSLLFKFADSHELTEDERAIVDMVMQVAKAKALITE